MSEHEKAIHIIKSIVCSSGGLLKPEDYICIKDAAEKLDINRLCIDAKRPTVSEGAVIND